MYAPPGLYYASDFRKRTAEALHVESLVRAHATAVRSIHDVTESLAADILAKFPAAFETIIAFQPDIRNKYRVENLVRANCSFSKFETRTKRPTAEQNSIYRVATQWHLRMPLLSEHAISLVLMTEERTASTAYDQISRFRSSLNDVHPTFGLHEQVASFAEQLQSDRVEGAALLLAQCLFHVADRQSPCKRLQHVCVKMREAVIQTRSRARLADKLEGECNNDSATFCSVQLGRHQYEQSQRSLLSSDVQSGRHRAYLALGSNLGNRVEMIESAVREMSNRGLTVLRTSALYETKPMYLENQEAFINGACEVYSTNAISVQANDDMARLTHL